MFIEKSKYLSSTGVRTMDMEMADGAWKKKLIRLVDTA